MAGRMLSIRALSPIHSGTGQSTGVIDLPVAREKITDWPYLPGSSLKGVLRDACDPNTAYAKENRHLFYSIFGPPTDNAADRAGALTFCDAHLLCLPIRSFYGTFAWITCPLALARWRDDAAAAGASLNVGIPAAPSESQIRLAHGSALVGEGRVFLEDLDFAPALDEEEEGPVGTVAGSIARSVFPGDTEWQARFVQRFGIVGDDLFTSLTLTGTEVSARIRLRDDSKTVADGGLWYEEAVPAETIFAAPVLVESRLLDGADPWGLVTERLATPRQIGGNASVGRGLAWFRLSSNGGQA